MIKIGWVRTDDFVCMKQWELPVDPTLAMSKVWLGEWAKPAAEKPKFQNEPSSPEMKISWKNSPNNARLVHCVVGDPLLEDKHIYHY